MFYERKCKVFDFVLENVRKVGKEIASMSFFMFSSRPFVLHKKLCGANFNDDEMED
jgi:hypothetical protein